MASYGNVQQKIHCVFQTVVVEESSAKRPHQSYKVVASERIREDAETCNIFNSCPSEKIDGTCVYIEKFCGKPWLWARLDRKPNKAADKRLKKYQNMKNNHKLSGGNDVDIEVFQWDPLKDFKDVPENWIPAKGVKIIDGLPYPDENGHIPGWVPVDPTSKQHCWHLCSVDLELGICVVLQPDNEQGCDKNMLCIKVVPMSDFLGCTLELIGTNVNANPYHLGTKPSPIHLLTRHGVLGFGQKNIPPLVYTDLKQWFENEPDGQVEGIVWHCDNGDLYKVHRHHLGLPWPVSEPVLSSKPVRICVDLVKYEKSFDPKSQFYRFGQRNGEVIENLKLL